MNYVVFFLLATTSTITAQTESPSPTPSPSMSHAKDVNKNESSSTTSGDHSAPKTSESPTSVPVTPQNNSTQDNASKDTPIVPPPAQRQVISEEAPSTASSSSGLLGSHPHETILLVVAGVAIGIILASLKHCVSRRMARQRRLKDDQEEMSQAQEETDPHTSTAYQPGVMTPVEQVVTLSSTHTPHGQAPISLLESKGSTLGSRRFLPTTARVSLRRPKQTSEALDKTVMRQSSVPVPLTKARKSQLFRIPRTMNPPPSSSQDPNPNPNPRALALAPLVLVSNQPTETLSPMSSSILGSSPLVSIPITALSFEEKRLQSTPSGTPHESKERLSDTSPKSRSTNISGSLLNSDLSTSDRSSLDSDVSSTSFGSERSSSDIDSSDTAFLNSSRASASFLLGDPFSTSHTTTDTHTSLKRASFVKRASIASSVSSVSSKISDDQAVVHMVFSPIAEPGIKLYSPESF